MSEKEWGTGVVIGLCFSCFICSLCTSLSKNNIVGSGDGPVALFAFVSLFLSGFAGLMAGIFMGRSIILRTNPSPIGRAGIYIIFPVITIFIFLVATSVIYEHEYLLGF